MSAPLNVQTSKIHVLQHPSSKPKAEVITQDALQTFQELREKLEDLQKEKEEVQKELENCLRIEGELAHAIIWHMINGARIQPGRLSPKLRTVQEGRRSITSLIVT